MHACVMQTEIEAPKENRLIQLYNLRFSMTFDQFEVNLKVLGLVNESRSVPFQSNMQT